MAAKKPIERPRPMFMQVAQEMAKAIRSGEYGPGDILPSDQQLAEDYGVGKHTVRSAIAELRGMGLVYTRQGKGTIVRERGSAIPAVTVSRGIQRAGKTWHLSDLPERETPAITRTALDGMPAALLEQQDQDAISVDRLLWDADTGVRIAHRTYIPLATAAEVPSLAEQPDAPVSDLYQQLTDAGHTLAFTEHVTARIPYPDERAALNLTDASPLLITYRVIADADGRPLLCEELTAPAATTRLTYPLTPSKAAAKRAPLSRPASE
ncbi:GntR family transcriptional regulator [Streptomyces sp. NPDC059037]|uniref:GntR family transcriptional regulator n=1 Tax=Streptomyces sp. NPDC059037 TaxID=3346710 RepID=UPI0036C8F968